MPGQIAYDPACSLEDQRGLNRHATAAWTHTCSNLGGSSGAPLMTIFEDLAKGKDAAAAPQTDIRVAAIETGDIGRQNGEAPLEHKGDALVLGSEKEFAEHPNMAIPIEFIYPRIADLVEDPKSCN